jgi:uridine kinase
MKTKLILVAGPSSSGKSTLAHALCDQIGLDCTQFLSLDHYYRDLRHLSPEARALRNFDEPEAWESSRLITDMQQLIDGHSIDMPQYDFNTHLRIDAIQAVEPTPYIVAEGLFALCYPALNAIATLKIFIDLDDTLALKRRLDRDILERGRSPECITRQFNETVRPSNQAHIRPSAQNAHLVLNGNQAIESNLNKIKQQLQKS